MTTAELIAFWARRGAMKSDHRRMCNDCAFKLGAKANLDPDTVSLAADAVVYEMSVFHCHQADHVCRGYLYAKEAFKR